MKTRFHLIFLLLALTEAKAQQTLTTDPLQHFRHFYEVGIFAGGTRTNTNYTHFNTPAGTYDFVKDNYLPAIDANFNFGWLFKDDDQQIWMVKTGFNLLNRSAKLVGPDGTELRLSTGYLQIPVQVGFRSPLKYNTVRNNLYRAVEFNGGVYAETPFTQRLDLPDNVDADGHSVMGYYVKFGAIGEIVFTALDANGHGHKFGLRVSNDFTTIAKIKETPARLYPYYCTVGLFYNISNRYK